MSVAFLGLGPGLALGAFGSLGGLGSLGAFGGLGSLGGFGGLGSLGGFGGLGSLGGFGGLGSLGTFGGLGSLGWAGLPLFLAAAKAKETARSGEIHKISWKTNNTMKSRHVQTSRTFCGFGGFLLVHSGPWIKHVEQGPWTCGALWVVEVRSGIST